jgi:hypothetical protein
MFISPQLLVVPMALPIASVRTCISRQCCINRYKQPIGELIMVAFVSFVYLATIVGVILPTLGKLINLEEVVICFFVASDPLCLSSCSALHFFRLFFLGPPPC